MWQEGRIPTLGQLKRWGKLTQEKYRRREGRFLVEGEKVVAELLASGRPLEALLLREERAERLARLEKRVPPEVGIFQLTHRQWSALSQDPTPEGVMAVAFMTPALDANRLVEASGPLLLLDRIGNPSNLGALLRTAHWFGFKTVLLGVGSCEATNPKTVRASMGSLFHLNIIQGVALKGLLPLLRQHYRIVGSDPAHGVPPHPCGPDTALLLGSESHGLAEPLLAAADERWKIPGGGAESLSLPQAAAILMYECTRGAYTNIDP